MFSRLSETFPEFLPEVMAMKDVMTRVVFGIGIFIFGQYRLIQKSRRSGLENTEKIPEKFKVKTQKNTEDRDSNLTNLNKFKEVLLL